VVFNSGNEKGRKKASPEIKKPTSRSKSPHTGVIAKALLLGLYQTVKSPTGVERQVLSDTSS